MGGVEDPTVGLDDALFEGCRELRCVVVEAADEVEALHLIAIQLEDFALEDNWTRLILASWGTRLMSQPPPVALAMRWPRS